MVSEPEVYYFKQTDFVPNSRLPVLVYRNVLPQPLNEESAQVFLENNQWYKGGTWGAVPRHHFHPNTHECYAVIHGSSTLLFGIGPSEDTKLGQKVHVASGDVIVIPAGVSHCSTDFQDDYIYVGVYPKDSPKWKNEYCRDADKCAIFRDEAETVVVPDWDPVKGHRGPLYQIWTTSTHESVRLGSTHEPTT
ncbi:hypothetical protein FMEXI_8255 [Fusarium mexicanum]|uniref:Cupin type-1 domain-containing protein n=1 Tax=Fusarium mexicanum TaxID=751941 RepID=A0A8H5MTK2_9HYPO|nr:hypothetical protein FMEXI_8255 [Fusarium mexicanum]